MTRATPVGPAEQGTSRHEHRAPAGPACTVVVRETDTEERPAAVPAVGAQIGAALVARAAPQTAASLDARARRIDGAARAGGLGMDRAHLAGIGRTRPRKATRFAARMMHRPTEGQTRRRRPSA